MTATPSAPSERQWPESVLIGAARSFCPCLGCHAWRKEVGLDHPTEDQKAMFLRRFA